MKKLALLIVIAFTFGFTNVFSNNEENKKEKSTAEVKVYNEQGSTKYNVLYKSEAEGLVRVQIYDHAGKIYMNDLIKKEKTFIKTFNFKDLPAGAYTMEIISKSGNIKKEINHGQLETVTLKAKVTPTNITHRYNLEVNSLSEGPISVRIYDNNNQLLFKETISENNFNKVYDLSSIKSEGLYFEVLNNTNRIVEKAF